ncbi:hypothetical protein FSP39_010602 [Pinctada imbricata]|uniref:NF-kappa-B inhibitor-interacting Ras-like protein 2 n=1 Tax=Pinctada imbricata TaxID=66713 RepID=A0AA88XD42_PINIB|nr:hypothetical protein FSP39_010602 [Pinctada imbricata]
MEYLRIHSDSVSKVLRKLSGCSSKSRSSVDRCSVESEDKHVRIAVLGGTKVGKTTLIRQLVHGCPPKRYLETIEDLYKYRMNNGEVLVDILDTSGSAEYNYFRSKAIERYDGFILVFSVTDKKSFHEVKDLRNQIRKIREKKSVPIVVAGNRMGDDKRFVKQEVITHIICSWGLPYIECSADDVTSIGAVFEKAVSLVDDDQVSEYRPWMGGIDEGRLFIKVPIVTGDKIVYDWMKVF